MESRGHDAQEAVTGFLLDTRKDISPEAHNIHRFLQWARTNNVEQLRKAVEEGRVDLTLKRHNTHSVGTRALLAASARGHVEVAKLLVGLPGVKLTKSWGMGSWSSTLNLAWRNRHWDMVGFLIRKMKPHDMQPIDDPCGDFQFKRVTPLMMAARLGDLELVKSLMDSGARQDLDKDIYDGRGSTLACALGRSTEIVRYLAGKGARMGLEYTRRWLREKTRPLTTTLLIEGVRRAGLDEVKLLVEAGENINHKVVWRLEDPDSGKESEVKISAVDFAHLKKRYAILTYLVSRKAKPRRAARNEVSLLVAAFEGNAEQVKRLLAKFSAKPRSRISADALMAATAGNQIKVIEELVTSGVDVNKPGSGKEIAPRPEFAQLDEGEEQKGTSIVYQNLNADGVMDPLCVSVRYDSVRLCPLLSRGSTFVPAACFDFPERDVPAVRVMARGAKLELAGKHVTKTVALKGAGS